MTRSRPRLARLRRLLKRTLACALLLLVIGNVVYAYAEGSGQAGQTIVTLSWIQLEDSKGINLWQYELSINFVDDVLKAGATIASTFTQILWQGYLGCAALAIWFVDWVLSFDWLNIIIGPLTAIGDSLRSVISRLGLGPMFLAISGAAAALFVFSGKMARGLYEALVAALILALSATVLSDPIGMVAGPDGWIYQTRDATMQLIGEMGDQSGTDTNTITSELITTFIRQPVQVISFGQIVDGTACEGVYDDAVRSGPHGYDDTIRNAVKECNEAAGTYADTPNMGMVSSVFIQGPAGILVMLIAIIIGGAVMLALISAVMASLKAVVNVALAVLPGGARRPLAQAFADIFISLGVFIFSMFFLGVYLMVIQGVYRGSDGQPSRAFVITLVFMILGLVAFIRYRKQLQAAAGRLTDWMSKRPGAGSPKPLAPAGQGSGLSKMAAVYGATKVLQNPRARQAIKTVLTAGAGAVSGNPALFAKALMGLGGRVKGKLPAVGHKPAPAKDGGHLVSTLPRTPRPEPEPAQGGAAAGGRTSPLASGPKPLRRDQRRRNRPGDQTAASQPTTTSTGPAGNARPAPNAVARRVQRTKKPSSRSMGQPPPGRQSAAATSSRSAPGPEQRKKQPESQRARQAQGKTPSQGPWPAPSRATKQPEQTRTRRTEPTQKNNRQNTATKTTRPAPAPRPNPALRITARKGRR